MNKETQATESGSVNVQSNREIKQTSSEPKKPEIPHLNVTFLTKDAPALLFSRKEKRGENKTNFISGADWFDSKIKVILNAVRDDDPFADQLIFDIENAINNLSALYKEELQDIKASIETKLNHFNASLEISDKIHVETHAISFQNRLTFDLLWALKDLDESLYYLYLSDKYAILPSQVVTEKRQDLRKAYRVILQMINRWKPSAITREDLAHNTQRVAKTFEINEQIQLTKDVLLLEKRAACAPNIKTRNFNKLEPAIKEKLNELYG
ncbi:AcaB family transcriptional regulator [Vibrio cincinnatiensis]|uniref:AcaB family transcriptional regulator n=1 Tax=Vibrio cincinnatiensis TaxID=675 RepID=UPI001EE05ADB|nr:AcaB family transcriptional regulator [Vibrio cincinnatiensis]MCG3734173.1 DUF1845 domain-containing protein [Vibrio cincinnatiensis]MCG3741328.1 DUF1845 domain-containing protein [Vibrio cincinnatiensis]MCG3744828.1 DUF1845 domain-containing protein [Vibrio cincinnatiensis]